MMENRVVAKRKFYMAFYASYAILQIITTACAKIIRISICSTRCLHNRYLHLLFKNIFIKR